MVKSPIKPVALTFIDPPSGWLYGFPKVAPDPPLYGTELEEWLVKEGYPQRLVKNLPYIRYFGGVLE
jgi:hypothetical protein